MAEHQDVLEEVIALIESGEFQDAADRAEDLMKMKVPDGWHLKSVALLHGGEEDESISVLKDGIASFPTNVGLRLELANTYMQLEKFDVADQVFEEAREYAGDQLGELDLMQARSEFIQGKVDEALNRLQQITDRAYVMEAIDLQLELLEAVGRTDLILEIAEADMEHFPTPENDEEFQLMAGILSRIASAHWDEKDDANGARQLLKLAFHYYRNHQDALWLWREMEPEFSTTPTAFSIQMNGRFQVREDLGDVSGKAYNTYYQVIASNQEEAIELIKGFEIDAVNKEAFEILEVEQEAADADEASGVYWVGDMVILEG